MTKAWIVKDTGYAGIKLPAGECVIISEDQRTFWPDAIRIIHRGHNVLVEPDNLTLDPHAERVVA